MKRLALVLACASSALAQTPQTPGQMIPANAQPMTLTVDGTLTGISVAHLTDAAGNTWYFEFPQYLVQPIDPSKMATQVLVYPQAPGVWFLPSGVAPVLPGNSVPPQPTNGSGSASPTTLSFAWAYVPTAAWPICSATITTGCVNGFTLSDATAGAVISSAIPGNSVTYSYRPNPFPAPGPRTYTLTANGVGPNGATVTSAPDSFTLTIPAPPPPSTGSPDGTMVANNDGNAITDSTGGLWTVVNGVVFYNGAHIGYSANVTLLKIEGGVFWQKNTAGAFYYWQPGGKWRGGVPPVAF